MFRRGQVFWYLIGGLLFLLAGIVALAGITIPYALPIMLITAGVIIIVAALLGHRPTLLAFVVFLIGIVVFSVAASGPYGLSPFTTVEAFELTRGQAPAFEQMTLLCRVSTGSIKVSFTSNDTQIYRLVFTKYFTFLSQPTVDYHYSVEGDELIADSSSTTASVDITLNQNIRCSFNLTTSTGSIRVDVPTTATRVRNMQLKATTGEVFVNLTNTGSLEQLTASTTTGQVQAYIKSSSQRRDAKVKLSTTTGRVMLNLSITDIESDIAASTVTGRVNDNVTGFTIFTRTSTSFHAQTPDYGRSAFKKMDLTATTTTGSVDIIAQHA